MKEGEKLLSEEGEPPATFPTERRTLKPHRVQKNLDLGAHG